MSSEMSTTTFRGHNTAGYKRALLYRSRGNSVPPLERQCANSGAAKSTFCRHDVIPNVTSFVPGRLIPAGLGLLFSLSVAADGAAPDLLKWFKKSRVICFIIQDDLVTKLDPIVRPSER